MNINRKYRRIKKSVRNVCFVSAFRCGRGGDEFLPSEIVHRQLGLRHVAILTALAQVVVVIRLIQTIRLLHFTNTFRL